MRPSIEKRPRNSRKVAPCWIARNTTSFESRRQIRRQLRNRDVEHILKKLADSSAGRLKVEKFDESNEGRPIYLATLGTGPRRVLLWSQMHGDEPTHTGVMLDLFSYLLQKPAKPQAEEILSGCTLMFIPMLNPDGAEVGAMRYNAQGNRHQSRLAPAGDARRSRTSSGGQNIEAAIRIQSAQPKCPDERWASAAAGRG